MAQPPGQHLLRIFQDTGSVGRIRSAVFELVRIDFKIEKQRRECVEMDVFGTRVADYRHTTLVDRKAEGGWFACRKVVRPEIELPMYLRAPVRGYFACDERQERGSGAVARGRCAEPVEDRGITSTASVKASTMLPRVASALFRGSRMTMGIW